MKAFLALVAMVASVAIPASAAETPTMISGFGQTTTPLIIEPGVPVQAGWQHSAAAGKTIRFRLYVDGVLQKEFTDAELTVTVSATDPTAKTYVTKAGVLAAFPLAYRGTHVLGLTAFDPNGGESARDAALLTIKVEPITTTPPPSPPAPPTGFTVVNIRVAVAPGGAAQLLSLLADAPLPPTGLVSPVKR
jgi:hypothetical protein